MHISQLWVFKDEHALFNPLFFFYHPQNFLYNGSFHKFEKILLNNFKANAKCLSEYLLESEKKNYEILHTLNSAVRYNQLWNSNIANRYVLTKTSDRISNSFTWKAYYRKGSTAEWYQFCWISPARDNFLAAKENARWPVPSSKEYITVQPSGLFSALTRRSILCEKEISEACAKLARKWHKCPIQRENVVSLLPLWRCQNYFVPLCIKLLSSATTNINYLYRLRPLPIFDAHTEAYKLFQVQSRK